METEAGWYSPAEDEPPEWGPCPTCGTANAAGARFCQACGRPLVEPEPDPAVADVLTAVVAELVSTTEAFALAPDADARLVAARDAFVAAGGTLRDLPADPHTVAAVFGPAPCDGVSTLTAVRAAMTARDAVTTGDVALRVGVGGSDIRGDDDEAVELWRGRVVDLALRLSRMAAPGGVILGEGAYRLIRQAVDAEAVDPRADIDGDDVGPLRLRGLVDTTGPATGFTPASDEAAAWEPTEAATWGPTEAAALGPTEAVQIEPTWTDTWNDTFAWGEAERADARAPGADAETESRDAAETYAVVDDAGETYDAVVDDAGETYDAADEAEPPAHAEPVAAPHDPRDAALLERQGVLSSLREALDRATTESRPVTVTLAGPVGSGRTSVARWFAGDTSDRAWTVEVTCPRPDAGGTSWPFAAIVRSILGVDGPTDRADVETRARAALGGAAEHSARLTSYLFGDAVSAPPDETRAAISALLSATVARRPLLLIVDDADRALPSSRDAFDSVVAASRGPLLVVLIVSDQAAATDVPAATVAPLSDDAVADLVERLLARPNLPPDAIAAIVGACDGIPLAVEHLVAMLADDGHLRWEYGRWAPSVDLASLPLPADLRALVARRVGGLRNDERRVAAVAAVAGTVDADAIAEALGLARDDVARVVASLIDRGVIRREADERIAFGHDAIAGAAAAYVERDAARVVHRLTADAMSEARAPGPDLEEVIGTHLERAFRARGVDGEAIGRRAAQHLVTAARGASDVGDEDAALALLRRAASVLPAHDAARSRLLLDSASTLAARGERGPAERLLKDAAHAARAAGDDLLEHRATLARARLLATASRIEDHIETLRDAAESAIAAAEAARDDATLAESWSARAWVHLIRGHFSGAAEASERAAAAASSAGRRRAELAALADLAGAIVDGPAPVDEAIERCRTILERARGTAVEPSIASALAVLLARAGRQEEARGVLAPLVQAPADDVRGVTVRVRAASVELHTGAPETAEALLRSALAAEAPPTALGAAHAWLAYVLAERGSREALDEADLAAALADEDDVVAQVTWRAAKARRLAADGRDRDARELLRLALRLADQTDLSELRARTRLDVADALLAAGRANEAGPAARSALRTLERKGSVAEARRARAILQRIAGREPPAAGEPDASRSDQRSGEGSVDAADAGVPAETTSETTGTLEAVARVPDGSEPPATHEPTAADGDAHGHDDRSERGRRERHWFW
jgi:tetratricopeptide (TPR) repeat protein